MKKKKMKLSDGRVVEALIPENDEDMEKIREMEKEKKVDTTDYMHGQKPASKATGS